jgi:hypothetical protein
MPLIIALWLSGIDGESLGFLAYDSSPKSCTNHTQAVYLYGFHLGADKMPIQKKKWITYYTKQKFQFEEYSRSKQRVVVGCLWILIIMRLALASLVH